MPIDSFASEKMNEYVLWMYDWLNVTQFRRRRPQEEFLFYRSPSVPGKTEHKLIS